MKRKLYSLVTAAALACTCGMAQASDGTVKIGVLTDMSSLYNDITGPGSVVAARMAIEDSGAAARGLKVELVSADHQNKADVGANIARRWYDTDHVDAIVDVPNSSVALAVNEVTREKGKVFLDSGAATSDLTGKACSPNTIHWTYDSWMLAHGTASAVIKDGGDTWFFIGADGAFGHDLVRDTSAVVAKDGGKVLGSVYLPLNTQDFSSALLRAQASKAKVIALANGGSDLTNAIKQAAEFGIGTGKQKLVGMLVFLSDVHSLGLKAAQGLTFTTSFYWDLNDQTRAWSLRYAKLNGGKYPTMTQAGVYSAVLAYLKAVEALGSASNGTKVVEKMKEMPIDDPVFGKSKVLADGQEIHPVYLVQVKKPSESKGPYDYYKVLATIPADQAFRPLDQSECPLVK